MLRTTHKVEQFHASNVVASGGTKWGYGLEDLQGRLDKVVFCGCQLRQWAIDNDTNVLLGFQSHHIDWIVGLSSREGGEDLMRISLEGTWVQSERHRSHPTHVVILELVIEVSVARILLPIPCTYILVWFSSSSVVQ